MYRDIRQWAVTSIALAALVAAPSAQDASSFKGGVRIAAGSCATYPLAPGATITSVTGDVRFSNPSQPLNVRVVCHLPVPEGAVVRRFVMVGKVSAGEIFATLNVLEPTDPDQSPFFANLTLTQATPFEVAGKQQKVTADLPATGSESLTVARTRAHFIDATVKTRTPVPAAQAIRLFYFEVYWN